MKSRNEIKLTVTYTNPRPQLRTIEADKNSLRATLAQLDDATSSFEEHDVHKQAVMVQNLQSCVERIGATQSLTNSIVLEIPHPYLSLIHC